MGGSESLQNFQYSIDIPGSEAHGSSRTYVNPSAKAYLTCRLPSSAETVYQNFKASVASYSERLFLGTRTKNPDNTFGNYTWLTYGEANRRVERIGWGLQKLGIAEKNEDGHSFLGLYAKNRSEWLMVDLACTFQNIISVPIYDTLQSDALDYMVCQTGMTAIAGSDKSILNVLKLRKEGNLSALSILIQFEPITEALRKECRELDLQLYSLEEVEKMQTSGTDNPPDPSSLYTICYTSGTTGRAKGAMLKHSNIISAIGGVQQMGLGFNEADSVISYLPLAHMMERIACHTLLSVGAAIGFFQGDILKLREDLAVLKPTIFISVPRLFNRFYDLITQQLAELTSNEAFTITSINPKLSEPIHLTHLMRASPP